MGANVQEIHIVKNVRIVKNAGCRKELSMKDLVLQRMEQELEKYQKYLVSGKITAKEMLDEAYQLVIKQGLYYIFANHNCSRLAIPEWEWLNQQENILDYLYGLWMHNDTDLAEEFAEIIHTEVIYDIEVHANE